MNIFLPILFATIAAAGNAIFALGQKQSSGVVNGLLFVSLSAMVAFLLSAITAPFFAPANVAEMVRGNWKALIVSGSGLFFTYVGFNLLYSRFGVSQYTLYAVISILTTTVAVGFILLKEPINYWHVLSILSAVASVLLFSIANARAG